MKKIIVLLFSLFISICSFAAHITGGEMFYTLVGISGNTYTYHVTLKLYRDCFSNGAQLDAAAPISIFNNTNFQSVWNNNGQPVARTRIEHLSLGSPSPCIQNPPAVCYDVGYYEFDVPLPASIDGYTIAYQRCCRIAGINNLINSSNVGATYTAEIPGTSLLASAPKNSSARFQGADTVAVCAHNPFSYDFGAVDSDGDSLSYYFCSAFVGGSNGTPSPNPPSPPPYSSVPYASGFDSQNPLGPNINVNPFTGLIKGLAPAAGIYVVTVCVDEWRNGIKIATQHKDLQIKVADCSLTTPQLDPQYITCNGFDLNFFNHNNNSLVHSYEWSFGDGSSSNQQGPTHTYADTGTYAIKLVVNKGEGCSDSATALAKVYPGFFPGFKFDGVCFNHPTQFTDTTKTKYGVINFWNWSFGDPANSHSILQNPSFTYTVPGTVNVQFIVGSSKGCRDTVLTAIPIIDRPPLSVAFKDTLICRGDFLQLQAIGTGNFSWSPGTNISNANTATPTVNPSVTAKYFVDLNFQGCVNKDTVQVRVANFITLTAMPDTVICATDAVQLSAVTNGLRYSWTPAATLNNPNLLKPIATPVTTTTYKVTSFLGGCAPVTDDVVVTLVPYPGSRAGADTVVCFGTPAQLNATISGSSFSWSPTSSLSNPQSLTPIATPVSTTAYVLTVRDTIGCPKPGRDTVLVTVLPKINAFAGRDTAVVIGQPLQLQATGGVGYLWKPATALNKNNIADPIGIYDGSLDSIRYKVYVLNEAGCVDSTTIGIRIFRTEPRIFVPTAFTPNGDGKNDHFRPIAAGIASIEYFRVFNRWGQLVYSSTNAEIGWDGRIGGQEQATGTFVWLVKAIDYKGKSFFAKGTVTLIR